jgi:uncharacterized membrane protein
VGDRQIALKSDSLPWVNIQSFGMCQSPINPAVAAATAAAQGVFTPQPCTPMPTGGWEITSTKVQVLNTPVLTAVSLCHCSFGGIIAVVDPGQSIATDGPG